MLDTELSSSAPAAAVPSIAPRAGHDVASIGLPGHLDSSGLDSEVFKLARILASCTPRAGQAVLKWPGLRLAVAQGCSPVENHLQAGQDTTSRSAGHRVEVQ